MNFIDENQHSLLFFIVALLVVFSWLSERTKIGQFLSGTIVIMLLGLILSNLHLLPHKAFAYDQIATYSVPLAIPLLLLNANIKIIFKKSGTTMLVFMLACAGVFFGAIAGYFLVDMGEFSHRWAGVFSASYTGGTLNFVAVSSALSLPKSGIAAAIAADTVVGISYLFILMGLSRCHCLLRWYPLSESAQTQQECSTSMQQHPDRAHWLINAGKLCLILALSSGIFIISREVAEFARLEQFTILIVTIFSLLMANLLPQYLTDIKGIFQVGTLLMYGFFFVIGTGTELQLLLDNAKPFVMFLLILLAVHILVVGIGARLMNIGLPELIIASVACITGPSVAAAVAANRKWMFLITPGILCGTLGYGIGNFIGIFLAYILS